MKKLIKGIGEFRQNRLAEYRERFSHLALGQKPDALFIGCSDSRVVPNVFASSDPGDLFVIRNVGNLMPPCEENGQCSHEASEWAAVEFALRTLPVTDIIVCGHSECGAMRAILTGRGQLEASQLRSWLRHGERAREFLGAIDFSGADLAEHNRFSKANVLLQVEHLKTHPLVRERIAQGTLALHAWWFDIASGDVERYEEARRSYVLIEEVISGKKK